MNISKEEIKQKKRELGIEPLKASNGPAAINDELIPKMQSEASESIGAQLVDNQRLDEPEGTNQRNQYRYGGQRP